MSIENDAFRYAIKNAFDHKGKADLGAVIGKVKALHKDAEMKKITASSIEAVKKVNAMEMNEIEKEFKGFEKDYELKPKEGRTGLEDLEWASKEEVVTRYAPNPNGPLHLGNARAAYLSYAYAEKYDGRFILRFEDTDPKIKKPIANAEEIFKEDLEWLGVKKIDGIYFASSRMETYYLYMKKLIEMDKAYVCVCESEKWKKCIDSKKACPCRGKKPEINMEEFEKMLSHEVKEGSAVLRIKTDLENPDPSVRDWWLARVVDKPENPKAGNYFVWPSFMFQSAIDDHEMGITFIIRGQEHSQNSTKQKYLYDYFEWKQPHAAHFGRFNIKGMVLSTSKIKQGIEDEIYEGWDDVRLGTIRALRRRGFKAEALTRVIIDSGLTSSDASVPMHKLAAYNKELIEKDAKRTTYIQDTIRLQVVSHEKKEIEKDGKVFELGSGIDEFIVSKADIEENPVFRLRNAYNVKIDSRSEFEASGKFAGTETGGKKIVNWIKEDMDVEILMPDSSREVGAIESASLKKGQYLYIEKKGYCIVDSVEGKRPLLVFTHE